MLWRIFWKAHPPTPLQCCFPSARMKDVSTQVPEFIDLTTLPESPKSPRTPRPPTVRRQSVRTKKMEGSTTSYFTSRSGDIRVWGHSAMPPSAAQNLERQGSNRWRL